MAEWWEPVLQNGLAVGVALLPAILVYYLNEQSKRKAFEREKKYDRKREAYEKALSALREVKEALELMTLQFLDPSIFEDLPKQMQERLKPVLTMIHWFGALMVRIRFGDKTDVQRIVAEYRESEDMEGLEKGAGEAFIMVMTAMIRADAELSQALASLSLAAAPKVIRESIMEVTRRLRDSAKDKTDVSWFEDEISEIEEAMRTDLKATIKP